MPPDTTHAKPVPVPTPVVVKHVPTKFTDAHPNIPVAAAANIPVVADEQPPVADYKGVFVNKFDGEKYAQCIRLDDPRGKTHKMLNSAHFWEGTETEFRLTFEKE